MWERWGVSLDHLKFLKYLIWSVSCTLYLLAILWEGFPLHKPYPYSLYEDSSILGTWSFGSWISMEGDAIGSMGLWYVSPAWMVDFYAWSNLGKYNIYIYMFTIHGSYRDTWFRIISGQLTPLTVERSVVWRCMVYFLLKHEGLCRPSPWEFTRGHLGLPHEVLIIHSNKVFMVIESIIAQ